VSWMPLALLVVSSPLLAVFIIGCYLEGLFCVPLAFGTHERCTWLLVHEHVFIRSPQNYEALALFLVLTDERCLNALLSVVLFPSNSTHVFWIRDLEFYEYLEVCSH
jgi:hypothetical protein